MSEKSGADPRFPKIEPLGKKHDRAAFSCGNNVLDTYIKKRASQEARKNIAATFVLVRNHSHAVVGYYTLSATSILLSDLPTKLAKKLPRYPHVPASLLGRLAIDSRHQGKGYGEILLIDALRRVLQATTEVASFAVVVDAVNEQARSFYKQYGFCNFPNQKLRLFLPVNTIAVLFS